MKSSYIGWGALALLFFVIVSLTIPNKDVTQKVESSSSVTASAQPNNLQQARDCNSKAESVYNNRISNLNSTITSQYNYKNHYNTSLGKCFVDIWFNIYRDNIMFGQEELYDAYENNQIGEFVYQYSKEPHLIECRMDKNYFCTAEEYTAFSDSKMEVKKRLE